MDAQNQADLAALEIWDDLTDRRGVKQALLSCDRDIQREIRSTMSAIILLAIEGRLPSTPPRR